MKLSTKGRYAMVALSDIALQPVDRLVSLGEISERQDISLPYLEQLFVKLRRADLVASSSIMPRCLVGGPSRSNAIMPPPRRV